MSDKQDWPELMERLVDGLPEDEQRELVAELLAVRRDAPPFGAPLASVRLETREAACE